MPKPRSGTSYRLSEEAQNLLAKLASGLGVTKTSVLEMAIRKLANAEFGEGAQHLLPTAGLDARPANRIFGQEHQN